MNAAATMARVYQAVKARILAGSFAPGDRIDPARLAPDLAASVTPIRDALYRLTGERLVESWQQEGFRQPLVSEPGMRDLYAWSGDLLGLILREAARAPPPAAAPGFDDTDYATGLAESFQWLAGLSPNYEHRAAIASLNDRSHVVRSLEPQVLADFIAPLQPVVDAVVDGRWHDARRHAIRFHAARARAVPALAALMRPRDR